LKSLFYDFTYCRDTNKPEVWEFLESLKLTEKQYRKLQDIIDDYGLYKYSEGADSHVDD
jgi:hypothetical protein